MPKDRTKQEAAAAEKRALAVRAQPTDESYYERLLKLRDHCLSHYEKLIYEGNLNDAYKYRSAFNHAAHQIENYEKLNGKSGSGSIEITWNMPDIGKWDEEQEKKHVNRPE